MTTKSLEEAWTAVCVLLDADLTVEAIAEARRLATIDPTAEKFDELLAEPEKFDELLAKRPHLANALDRLGPILRQLEITDDRDKNEKAMAFANHLGREHYVRARRPIR